MCCVSCGLRLEKQALAPHLEAGPVKILLRNYSQPPGKCGLGCHLIQCGGQSCAPGSPSPCQGVQGDRQPSPSVLPPLSAPKLSCFHPSRSLWFSQSLPRLWKRPPLLNKDIHTTPKMPFPSSVNPTGDPPGPQKSQKTRCVTSHEKVARGMQLQPHLWTASATWEVLFWDITRAQNCGW